MVCTGSRSDGVHVRIAVPSGAATVRLCPLVAYDVAYDVGCRTFHGLSQAITPRKQRAALSVDVAQGVLYDGAGVGAAQRGRRPLAIITASGIDHPRLHVRG